MHTCRLVNISLCTCEFYWRTFEHLPHLLLGDDGGANVVAAGSGESADAGEAARSARDGAPDVGAA